MQVVKRLLAASTTLCCVLVVCQTSVATIHLYVGTPEQGGQYATVQAAVDAVPVNNTERHVINIRPGTYMERVIIPTTKPYITLRGEDPLTTKLTFNLPANALPNNNRNWASTVVEGNDFIAENLTFENSYGTGAQALAMYAKADRLIFNNTRFLGNQDTLRSEQGRHYFLDTYVEGTVDFIYGKGTAYFEDSTIFGKTSGYLTAQGRESAAETSGFVFKNATITGSAPSNSFYLGRPWAPYSRTVFLDSKMGPLIRPQGWSTWSGDDHLTTFYAEYNSMDLDGDPLDVSQRVNWSHQLTAEEAEAYSLENWLAGWTPNLNPVESDLTGDYNESGVIDAADYTIWRDAMTAGIVTLTNDPTPGTVDESDFIYWRDHFGAADELGSGSGQGAAAVPEPATLSLIAWCLTLVLLVYRGRVLL